MIIPGPGHQCASDRGRRSWFSVLPCLILNEWFDWSIPFSIMFSPTLLGQQDTRFFSIIHDCMMVFFFWILLYLIWQCVFVYQVSPSPSTGGNLRGEDQSSHLARPEQRERVRPSQQPRAHRPTGVRGLLLGRWVRQTRVQGRSVSIQLGNKLMFNKA